MSKHIRAGNSEFYSRLLWWLSGKELACQCRRYKFDPWIRKNLGEENSNSLLCSCLENSKDRGAWRSTVQGVTKSQTELSAETTKIVE